MRDFNKFFKFYKNKKKNFIYYTFLSFIVGTLELFGVALTYPFIINLLNNSNNSTNNTFFNSAIFVGLLIFTLFLAKNIFMIFYTNLQTKFITNMEIDINISFLKYFLSASYKDTAKIPIAKKLNILNFIIPNVINNYLQRLLNINVNFFIFILISLFLIIKFPIASITTIIIGIIILFIQNKVFKKRLQKIANEQCQASTTYNQKTNDVILHIKSVKISRNEFLFFKNYQNAIKKFYNINRINLFYKMVPPYVTEPLVIILLFILIGIISLQNYSEPEKLVATYALIASAIFRLTPTITRIQTNLNGIHTSKPIIKEFLEICKKYNIDKINDIKPAEYLDFNNSIELKNINFSYNEENTILKNINLKIHKGEFIGIAGTSGAGKTTLIDIISGLLTPSSGEILIDNKKYSKPLKIGYIPQEINLINDTIKNNIAFGTDNDNDERIIQILKNVDLYDFINQTYKDGIYTNPFIDSSGLSQGQKQRLAIAKALYNTPDILILDEATSSLDLKTEEKICNILNTLKGSTTIIAIAHRLSTIKNADKIIFMKNGEIKNIAPFNELITLNNDFNELVNIGNLK